MITAGLGLLVLMFAALGFRAEAAWRLQDKEAWPQRVRLSLLPFGYGACQDLLLAALLSAGFISLFALLPPLLAKPLMIVLLLAHHGYLVIDSALFRTADLRMNVGFLGFASDLSSFHDSIEALLPRAAFGALAAFFAAVVWLAHVDAGLGARDLYAMAGVGALALFGVLVLRTRLSPALRYAYGNVLIEDLFRRATGWRAQGRRLDAQVLTRFRALGAGLEQRQFVSDAAPLLKHTRGFEGEKRFELRVGAGERPHVLLVFLESFCARDTGALGGRAITPCFDAAAKDGVLFRNFYAGGIQTSRAVLSTLFGLWPRLAYRSEMQSDPSLPVPSLAELMNGAGYRSAYWHGGDNHFENQGLFFSRHGFAEVSGDGAVAQAYPEATRSSWGLDDRWVYRYALDAVQRAQEKGQPTFGVLATLSSHHPYLVPDTFQPSVAIDAPHPVEARFLRSIHYSDACFGEFLAELGTRGLADDTIVIALGDHGPPIGEFVAGVDRYQHLLEERVHVPLLIWSPSRAPKLVIEELASQVDILPTLLDALSIFGPNVSVGDSLLRVRKEPCAVFNNAMTVHSWGMRQGSLKYLWSPLGSQALYDLAQDPEEQRDLGPDHPAVPAMRDRLSLIHQVLEAVHSGRRWG